MIRFDLPQTRLPEHAGPWEFLDGGEVDDCCTKFGSENCLRDEGFPFSALKQFVSEMSVDYSAVHAVLSLTGSFASGSTYVNVLCDDNLI